MTRSTVPAFIPEAIEPELHPHRIYRHVTLDLPTFDVFKNWQRRLESAQRRSLSNSEVLRMLILALPEA